MKTTNTWSRRRLLGAGLAAGAVGLTHMAAPFTRAIAGAKSVDEWSAEFAARLASNPALLGWKGVASDRLAGTARIEGQLPPDLRGTLSLIHI